ncbi:MAG: uroporphyrinogen decarboxylase family protein [Armatimonadota bacterium]
MTQRERLLAPFRGVRPDRPAWAADLSYWYTAMEQMGRLEARYAGEEGYQRLHEDLGVCVYYGRGGATYRGRCDGVETGVHQEGRVRTRWWRTPAGEISDRWDYLEQAHCWAHTQYAVKTLADLRVVQDIFARTRYEPAPESFLRASAAIGDAGLPICAVPRSPLPALMTDWCGVVTTSYLLADEPAAVEDTLATIDQAVDAAFAAICEGPAELLHCCDNLDSNTYTSLFDRYMREYYARRLAQLHAAGKCVVTHLDGFVRGLLPRLCAVGFDGIESITPAPVGDVEIEELRALCGTDRTIIWGGIPGAMFAPPWTAAAMREHTIRLLDALAPGGRLVVGSADQVPPDGDIELCRLIAQTIDEHSRGARS